MRWLGRIVLALVVLVAIVVVGGLMLPVVHVATVRADVAAPPGDVYGVLLDVENAPAWRTDLDQVTLLSAPDEPLRWQESGRYGELVFVVEEATAPRRLVSRIVGRDQGFGGRWIYELAPATSGTTVTITEEGEVHNPAFRFMARYVFGHHRTMETYLRHLGARFGTPMEPVRVR